MEKTGQNRMLAGKRAAVYGASGAIGSAVARAFAQHGAAVFLAGRNLVRLNEVAEAINRAGGSAAADRVDALDEASVAGHVETLVQRVGGVDISFNAVTMDDRQGMPLMDMSLEDFGRPIAMGTRTSFLIARAVAPRMVRQGSGVILMITATPARMAFPLTGGFGVACAAIEGLTRTLAAELGPHGVRVICLRSAGSPESILGTMSDHADGRDQASPQEFIGALEEMTLLKRMPTLADVGHVAALMASDYANPITGTTTNMTCGTITD